MWKYIPMWRVLPDEEETTNAINLAETFSLRPVTARVEIGSQ